MKFENIVNRLITLKRTIATMESCTGGFIANNITNIDDSSLVFMFGAVTYSNLFKIKMGVDSNIISKYSVYSMETADSMSKSICNFTNANYGVGITGKLNKIDKNNDTNNKNNSVYISIYDNVNNKYYNREITVLNISRIKNKELILNSVISLLDEVIK